MMMRMKRTSPYPIKPPCRYREPLHYLLLSLFYSLIRCFAEISMDDFKSTISES